LKKFIARRRWLVSLKKSNKHRTLLIRTFIFIALFFSPKHEFLFAILKFRLENLLRRTTPLLFNSFHLFKYFYLFF